MKKQFFRVKQLADQTFLRAEKSEILNHEELQIAAQKSEVFRNTITAVMKKIAPNGLTNDMEKCVKKCFEYQLGSSFLEESKLYQECQLFQQILRETGFTEHQLAQEYAEYEIKVEELVYLPLQTALENEFPNIMKYKYNLRKYCLDKDSASNRYNATKKETLKGDMEEADSKVEQNRDMLAIEMFNLLAKENEFSEYILQLLKLQRGYHESALKILETVIPVLETKIGNSPIRKVFGTSLKEHLRVTGKKIAYPLEICITALSEYGILEEGLFRIAGSATKVRRLKSAIDSGCFSWLIPEYQDAHVLASTLKLYLRELPEPLLTFGFHKEWLQVMQYQENQRLGIIKHLIQRLPQENQNNLCYLLHFLSKCTQHTENKMSPSNIAIVLSPSLLWTKNENANIGNCLRTNALIEILITEVSFLFPDDVNNYVTSKLNEEFLNHCNDDDGHLNIISPKPSVRKKKSAPVPPCNSTIITSALNLCVRQEDQPNVNVNFGECCNSYNIYMNSIPNCEQNINNKPNYLNTSTLAKDNYGEDRLDEYKNKNLPISPNRNDSKNISKLQPIVGDKQNKYDMTSKKAERVSGSHENINKIKINIGLKPEVPARPISLLKILPSSVVLKKTQCPLYNVADKLNSSIGNIERHTMSKHNGDSNRYTEIENKNALQDPLPCGYEHISDQIQ